MTSNSESDQHSDETSKPVEPRPRPDFKRFTAIDTETTGLDPKDGEIIELGAVRFVEGVEVESFSTLVKPERGIPERNRRLTGIRSADLESAPHAGPALEMLRAFLGDDLLVIHNADFDLKFLAHFLKKAGIEAIANQALCTQRLAAFVEPQTDSLKLQLCAGRWGIDLEESHRALGDARTAGLLALKLIGEMKTWPAEFAGHLASYRGKSIDPLFDLFDSLAGESKQKENGSFRLDEEIKKRLIKGKSKTVPSFPDRPGSDSPGRDGKADAALKKEGVDAFKRGGLTFLEDFRAGSGHVSDLITPKQAGVSKLIVGVPDEEYVGLLLGENWDLGTDGKKGGTAYLGRRSEYVCFGRAFDERDGRPDGWIELSPYERVVLVRWLAGTATGRISRISWWLLNNFSGLKGLLYSLGERWFDCGICDHSKDGACWVELARKRASNASRILVDHIHLVVGGDEVGCSDRTLDDIPACIVEKADVFASNARTATTRELEVDTLARHLARSAEKAEFKGDPGAELHGDAGRVMMSILEAARRCMKSWAGHGTDSPGTVILDDSVWGSDEFGELADAVDSGAVRLADILRAFREQDPDRVQHHPPIFVLTEASAILEMIRKQSGDYQAVMEGAPHRNPRRISFKVVPVDVRAQVRDFVDRTLSLPKGGILAVGRHLRYLDSFERIRAAWGRDGETGVAERALEDSALALPHLFLPVDIFPPSFRSGRAYEWEKFIDRTANILRMISESLGGRTVAVFSSNQDLRETRFALDKNPPRELVTIAQYHDGTKSALVREFLSNPRTLLLGGRSLADGVDFRPAGFTVLVLVKIPFPSPDDIAHRSARAGEDVFRSQLIPVATQTINRWIDCLLEGEVPEGKSKSSPPGAIILLDMRPLKSDWGEEFLSGLNVGDTHRMPFREVLAELQKMSGG